MKRERQLKGWTHAKKKALIDGDITRLKNLARRRPR
jgi:predicted GIY-YIG superfamily endonuclease